MRLEDKVAIITGAASGIGRAIAETFAREGAKVVIADINEERMMEVVVGIREAGGEATCIITDVRKQEDNDAMMELAIQEFGGYDILVANAGVMDDFEPIGHVTDELWERVVSINTFGPMMQIRSAVNYFEKNGGGAIVVTSSVAGMNGGRSGLAYTASKRATIGLVENTAFAYAEKGIRINAIAPGGVKTNISESMKDFDPEGGQIFNKGGILMPRLGEPQELANVALFLASDEASFVNGAVIPVDGGWNAY